MMAERVRVYVPPLCLSSQDAATTPELGKRRALRLPTQMGLLDGNLYIAATGSNQVPPSYLPAATWQYTMRREMGETGRFS